MLPVPIGSSRNSNFKADVLETHSHWTFLPMIFVISTSELTKTARSAFKVLGVGSIGLLVSLMFHSRVLIRRRWKGKLLIMSIAHFLQNDAKNSFQVSKFIFHCEYFSIYEFVSNKLYKYGSNKKFSPFLPYAN